eukprot:12343779-Prorocentrum_lima.AAC.1
MPVTTVRLIHELFTDWNEEFLEHRRARTSFLRQAERENGEFLRQLKPVLRGPRVQRSAFYRNMAK